MSEVKTNKISSLASNNDITLDPNGTGDTIIASGKVGINTVSPEAMLQVENGDITVGWADNFIGAQFQDGSAFRLGMKFGTVNRTTKIVAETSDNNGEITFETNGSERMRVDTNGDVIIGKTSASFSTKGFFLNVDPGQLDITCNGNNPLRLNRLASDGILTSYQQAGSEEGTVSVSGTTVSYNGGHLSRWSRLTSGNKDTSIVKGTVMTNLDQMVVWTHAATDDEAEWTEDNEQLNCMAVSSVEGDANVAGVFVNWDDRDSYNDMNIAMTGDMVIRIASGTTVARGDLLMSAGDGTAKPQDDDIVRSKTIAKVTSITKSHTYDDGTYLVPCVLMAC